MELHALDGTKVIVNPRSVTVVQERRDPALSSQEKPVVQPGALLVMGPDEIEVREDFQQVHQAIEAAWEREGCGPVNDLLEPLQPLAALLPMFMPAVLAGIVAKAGHTGAPPAPPTVDDVKNAIRGAFGGVDDEGPGTEGGEVTPAEALERAAAQLPGIACRNCNKRYAPAARCPHCGADTVGCESAAPPADPNLN